MDSQLNYNLFQQSYCLSVAANIASHHEGTEETLENEMKQTLNQTLPTLPGKWEVTWGPRVIKEQNKPDSPKGGPDNVWYAATDETQKICVVAIAGTAHKSWVDWLQNLAIQEVVDFNAWVDQWSSDGIPKPQTSDPDGIDGSTVAYCAKGTCIGAWNILSNSSTVDGEVMRIDQYLSRLDESYSIVFTGHSLGGVLAPTVALGLRTADMVGPHDVKVLASAGVSPGNDKLAANYAASFSKTPESAENYQVYNTDYYNEFDIVPQAWSINLDDDRNLGNILSRILRLTPSLKPWADAFVGIAKKLSLWSKIQYTPLPGQKFTGPTLPEEISSWDDVEEIVSKQHTHAYWDEIGIADFANRFETRFKLCEGAEAE
ncbi:uncharacterized protein F4822DRAFT_389616 [Hypoxylon trugodes]|uniref:uncharacterized protein n=1 Tax=Hypoxylon trugodes TaxID=326681 RepID=UPI00219B19C4|nr:uncharacterized protein F4822DRAFT_389616 [Hypoxylon trugodes]KAI1392095.1 hypothetical protein F4822DRAFT_389616 [Hypoxylon trugodes]